nr:unnamed protein product [Digitaria exilis]
MRPQAWGRGAVARLMRPFNRRTAHASSAHLLRPCPSSSYSTVHSRLRRHFASSSSSSPAYNAKQNTHTFMEVFQEVLEHGSANGVRTAIRADKRSYSLLQLIAASLDMAQNGIQDSSFKGINGTGFLHGARVGIVAKPSPEFVAGVFGTWLSGGVAVPLALSYPEAELLHVMNDSVEFIPKFSVPTMYTRLLQGYDNMDPDQQSASCYAAKQLRLMMCGSSALPSPLMKRWEEVTGHRLLERYGMTEFVMALSNPLHGIRKEGTVGKPLPRVEAKIMMDDGTETTTGVGELCIRSPSLFKEYWKRPEVTAESFIDGGFFKTGDTVTLDEEGYFIILGRTNADIIKVGGYKLSALEIEAVLLGHDALLECAVLGLPDEAYGEVVCAIIVPKEDAKKTAEEDSKPALTLEALTSWSKDKLAPYKIPTRLYLWDSLPRNAMGKVNKKELKKLLGA